MKKIIFLTLFFCAFSVTNSYSQLLYETYNNVLDSLMIEISKTIETDLCNLDDDKIVFGENWEKRKPVLGELHVLSAKLHIKDKRDNVILRGLTKSGITRKKYTKDSKKLILNFFRSYTDQSCELPTEWIEALNYSFLVIINDTDLLWGKYELGIEDDSLSIIDRELQVLSEVEEVEKVIERHF